MENLLNRILGSLRLGRALRFVWKSDSRLVVANAILVVTRSALPLAFLFIIKLLIDEVSTSLGQEVPLEGLPQTLRIVAAGALLMAVIVVLRSTADYIREALAQTVTDYMYSILHAKSIEVDLEYYENPQYYDSLHRAQQEASFRPLNIVNGLLDIAYYSVSLLAVAGLLFTLHWVLTIVLLFSVFPGLLVRLRYSQKIYHWQRQRTQTERQSSYYDMMLTNGQHAKEMRLFDLGHTFLGRFAKLRGQLRKERLEIIKRRSTAELITGVLTITIENIAYAFMAYLVLRGSISIGSFVLYLEGFRMGQDSLYSLLYAVADLYEDNLFLANLYEFLDIKRVVKEPQNPKPVSTKPQKGFVFEGVSFQYPALTRPVLEDINISIDVGEVVALVGENGSGKTTLTKLLCRLYDPTAGKITYNGVDLRDYTTIELRKQFGVLFQDYVNYNLSATENIWLGDVDAEPEPQRIEEVARMSGILPVVNKLPNGFDTMLGKWFDNGEELSIGEWQKFGLSRAYWRDAPILILDEPTSAMDPRSESHVFDRFRELIAGKTAIIVSHRLSTVRMADRIYVMENGSIVEQGKHDDLMLKRGKYAELFELQAVHYR